MATTTPKGMVTPVLSFEDGSKLYVCADEGGNESILVPQQNDQGFLVAPSKSNKEEKIQSSIYIVHS